MSKLTKALTAAAGNAAGDPLYVEDVFSTYLYDGTGAAHTITNGIDLAGEGGLTWIKTRNTGTSAWHSLSDTERGAGNILRSDLTNAQNFDTAEFTSFNSDGFTVGNDTQTNGSGRTYASWTFRKAEKFFDVQTYTGDGVAGRTVAHNLGSSVGALIVKRTDSTSNWWTWHKDIGTNYLSLNTTGSQAGGIVWNYTAPTDSVFTVGDDANTNGATYVAYLFASDAGGFGDDGSENIIKCGSYTEPNNGAFTDVDLGFEPQFIIAKCSSSSGSNWVMSDSMRGMPVGDGAAILNPNTSAAETAGFANAYFRPTATGFSAGNTFVGGGGETIIYIAIRRPMKTPESGTEVFKPNDVDNGASSPDSISGFPVDMYFRRYVNTTNDTYLLTRLTSPNALKTNGTDAEAAFSSSSAGFDYQNGVMNIFSSDNSDFHTWMFKRATGFMDVVCYTGTGTAGRTVAHNLGVVPECMIVKRRDGASSWITYWDALGATKGQFLDTNQAFTSSSYWNDTAPTATQLTLGSGSTNNSGATFIAYLFATLDGVSKVGSYTGTGNSLDIDCGFSNGARFVMIKRTDSSSDWWVWDTARGIVSGNDPTLRLNSTAAETTTADYIDPLSSGFTLTTAGNWLYGMNYPSGNYIFLAIA